MPQNINQYFNPNWKITLSRDTYYVAMTSDEMDYNQEVVFSPFLIAQTYGNKLPLYFDTNNEDTSQQNLPLVYGSYNPGNIFVSQNYYNINDVFSPFKYGTDGSSTLTNNLLWSSGYSGGFFTFK